MCEIVIVVSIKLTLREQFDWKQSDVIGAPVSRITSRVTRYPRKIFNFKTAPHSHSGARDGSGVFPARQPGWLWLLCLRAKLGHLLWVH
ncbi:hypothetical protein Rcae01_02173 [Novipirellula caenicola]|uniref:Uncharacterized protein n=1 Tax=Novipirellula caenicola TaxID=1536901 RepID=A0ABP9VQY1_9BACT